jgi:hypothetical protein
MCRLPPGEHRLPDVGRNEIRAFLVSEKDHRLPDFHVLDAFFVIHVLPQDIEVLCLRLHVISNSSRGATPCKTLARPQKFSFLPPSFSTKRWSGCGASMD